MRIFLLVAIPILSLIGVYAFAATTAASSAINLSKSRSAYNTISPPTGLTEGFGAGKTTLVGSVTEIRPLAGGACDPAAQRRPDHLTSSPA